MRLFHRNRIAPMNSRRAVRTIRKFHQNKPIDQRQNQKRIALTNENGWEGTSGGFVQLKFIIFFSFFCILCIDDHHRAAAAVVAAIPAAAAVVVKTASIQRLKRN